jgi:hypothetical protein
MVLWDCRKQYENQEPDFHVFLTKHFTVLAKVESRRANDKEQFHYSRETVFSMRSVPRGKLWCSQRELLTLRSGS